MQDRQRDGTDGFYSSRFRVEFLYRNAGNAVTIHLAYRKAAAAVLNALVLFRDMTALEKQEPSQSFKPGLSRQRHVVARLKIANSCAAFECERLFTGNGFYPYGIVFIANIAEYLLQHIL